MQNHMPFCAITISVRFRLPAQIRTVTITKPIDTS